MGKYDDSDDEEERRPRKRKRHRDATGRSTSPGRVIAIVVGGLVLASAVVLGVYKLTGKKLPFAKASVPAGWQQFTSEKGDFRGYFPGQVAETPVKMEGTVSLGGRVLMEYELLTIYAWEDKSRGVAIRVSVTRYKGPVAPEARSELLKTQSDPSMETVVRKITWSGRDAIDVSSPGGRSRTVYLERAELNVSIQGPNKTRAKPEDEDGFFDNFELLP